MDGVIRDGVGGRFTPRMAREVVDKVVLGGSSLVLSERGRNSSIFS